MVRNKTQKADLANKLAEGTQKHLTGMSTLPFGSGSFTPAEVEAKLERLATLRANANAARLLLQECVAAEHQEGPDLLLFMSEYMAFVMAVFARSPTVLADFGLSPRKPRTPLTVEQKVAQKAKSDATRKARGTKGKKQRLAIKGDVTGVVIAPVTPKAP